MQRKDLPQGTPPARESTRPEAMCSDSDFRVASRTLLIYHLPIYLFLVRAALGESKFPCDLTSPWQCFGNKLDSHGSPNGGRVPMSGKVFFIMKKKTKTASDLVCNFSTAARIYSNLCFPSQLIMLPTSLVKWTKKVDLRAFRKICTYLFMYVFTSRSIYFLQHKPKWTSCNSLRPFLLNLDVSLLSHGQKHWCRL